MKCHTKLPGATSVLYYVLQHSAVMAMLDTSSTLAFLELAWGSSTQGNVYIRLEPEYSMLAQQFLMLCTGERGSSYRNSRIFKVVSKSKPMECMTAGDCELNNGEGGATVLPGLDIEEERRSLLR